MYDLQFTPKKEEELIDLLEIGECDYQVYAAERKESKSSGLPMIELRMKIWDKNGQEGIVFDYLMLNDNKFSLRKIRHFCYSNGLEDFYENGKLNAFDCLNKSGKCKIGIQKDKMGQYPDKNVIADYLLGKPQDKSKYVPESEALNDDIPF